MWLPTSLQKCTTIYMDVLFVLQEKYLQDLYVSCKMGYWVKSISVTNNIILHKSAHYSHANTFIYITNVAGYIAIGLFSSYQGEAVSAIPTCLPLFSIVVMHMNRHATYCFSWWPSCCASMHPFSCRKLSKQQIHTSIYAAMNLYIYTCRDKTTICIQHTLYMLTTVYIQW